jgi:iron complex transport system ATP-binding protein
MIALKAATVRLDGRVVLRGIDFTARPGELVALVGPNGAGKSTLLRALAGLLEEGGRPDPTRVAYLPQDARCAWGLTVAEVAALGRLPHGDADAGAIARAIAACGLAALRDARVDRISGGEARRAMLARVLATEPEVLLLDEPTADLDPAAAHEIMALLAGLARRGAAVVVVLHALELAASHAGRMVVLQQGRIVADAAPAAALPAAAAAFGLPWGVDPSPRLLAPAAAP